MQRFQLCCLSSKREVREREKRKRDPQCLFCSLRNKDMLYLLDWCVYDQLVGFFFGLLHVTTTWLLGCVDRWYTMPHSSG